MKSKHRDYLTFKIPNDWEIEENDDVTSIYHHKGAGVLTLSFYTVMIEREAYETHVAKMAVRYERQYNLVLRHALILETTKKNKLVVTGIGETEDGEFTKLFFVGQFPKVVMATYLSETETPEVKIIDEILDSFRFKGL